MCVAVYLCVLQCIIKLKESLVTGTGGAATHLVKIFKALYMYPQKSPAYLQKRPLCTNKHPKYRVYTATEPCISAKEPYVSAKEPYISSSLEDLHEVCCSVVALVLHCVSV